MLHYSSAVYITFINEKLRYELRSVNALQGGVTILAASENPEEVCERLFELTKGVAVESTV